ncbi:MAG: ATP-grasp domain-containing protein, partial [Wenzhouxiangellaceae bacterium]
HLIHRLHGDDGLAVYRASLQPWDLLREDVAAVPEDRLRAAAAAALAAAQDRLVEKERFSRLGIATPEYRAVETRADLAAAVADLGFPAVLKTRRFGYDGKGQWLLRQHEDLELAWREAGEHPLILEQWLRFDHECAITAVRGVDGELRFWPLSHTVHRSGILRLAASRPAPDPLTDQAREHLTRLAEDLEYVGCLTLELFAIDGELLANEFAPRVHNSAHWSIEGAHCSQFENHLRAVCGWPLGDTAARGRSLMVNFIGAMPERAAWLALSGLHWHDYGKSERAGRKVGHATLCADDEHAFEQSLRRLAPLLVPEEAQSLTSMASDSAGSNSTR